MAQAALKQNPQDSGYPFAALVGQGDMRRALIICAVDPGLGGVLLSGEKGTAKSTAARGLGRLWAAPFVDLPLGATEDRVLGSLDLEAAILLGETRLVPGLLSRAHGGVLYIDEVNLLPQHLAHLILDAASSGVVHIEREGLSATLPASFALIASMNPEEGPVGPQLMDRFGLFVEVTGERDPELRKEVIRRRLAYEADPTGFAAAWAEAQAGLGKKLVLARAGLGRVTVPEETGAESARLAALAHSRGQRAEICLVRAARALAAWRGLALAGPELLAEVATLALAHRTEVETDPEDRPEARFMDSPPAAAQEAGAVKVKTGQAPEQMEPGSRPGNERSLYVLTPEIVMPIATRLPAREGTSLKKAGRRRAREVSGDRGRYLRASSQRLGRSLAFDATFRAAAPHQNARRAVGGPALVVKNADIREKVRAARRGRLILFCVDASGSMNAAARMRTTKAAVLGLLTEAYQKRDRVGVIAFGGVGARELLPPTASVEVARQRLEDLPTGGKTPLAAGMVMVSRVLARELAADPKLNPLVIFLTDGRPNVPLAAWEGHPWQRDKAGDKGGGWGDGWGDGGYADREVLNLARRMSTDGRPNYVVVDTDTHNVHEINLCRPMADYLGARCVSLGRLTTEGVLELVKVHW